MHETGNRAAEHDIQTEQYDVSGCSRWLGPSESVPIRKPCSPSLVNFDAKPNWSAEDEWNDWNDWNDFKSFAGFSRASVARLHS